MWEQKCTSHFLQWKRHYPPNLSSFNYENAPIDDSAWEKDNSSLQIDRGACWSKPTGYCRSAAAAIIPTTTLV